LLSDVADAVPSAPMCVNCLSHAEVVAGNLGLAAAVLKAPIHRTLADLGVVTPFDEAGRDARTVAFLRRLDLDPVEILGRDVVTAADAWVATPQDRRARRSALAAASALPIGSQI
jgi:hypothetical protein